MPCSSPDCSLPQTAACTDQCVVVTHRVDAPCDGNCDAAPVGPCDSTACDGFDTNWVCDGDNCSAFGQFLSRPEDLNMNMKAASQLQGFPHILDSTPSFSPFFCACASGDFSNCLDPSHCATNCNLLDNAAFLRQQHQQLQQSHTFQSFTSPIQIPQHNVAPSPSTGSAMTPSTASFHSSPSPMFSHQQPAMTPQQVQQELEKQCLWSDCNAVFPSTGDLFAHLSSIHIPGVTDQQPAQAPPANLPTSCLWDDCSIFPNLSSIPGPSANPGPAAVTNFLTTHLLQDHLGLERPPQTMSPAVPTPGSHSPANSISTRAGTIDPTSEEDSPALPTAAPQVISVSPYNEPRTLAVSDPNAHACLWIGCNEVFATCDTLTAHIAAAHVGSGKAQYECQWRGCSRSGAQPFASKQKILRHMQSHTGHRPFQCSVCKQNFSESATLQQHMRRHTHEKPYQCDFPGCGKAFAITGALTIHKRIHNGEKPFKCTYCERAFSESSNLSKHLRTHTGARPYPCLEPGCEKRFARPDQVSRHMNVHRKAIKMEVLA
ncbi:hypothetical protein EXIGLDRAFT_639844 [Exidia glandulosa HHB12029]|uniref:C2H2-type domain-containing protein n=1 Tax=Exidia glandulosa HHB12029 TaxID=1314781 RepID=A0A166BCQ7_EXIGL|nr:hypothetical protein EXIGLDRAFT_639844 [Exidia glandulosa HHB12029]